MIPEEEIDRGGRELFLLQRRLLHAADDRARTAAEIGRAAGLVGELTMLTLSWALDDLVEADYLRVVLWGAIQPQRAYQITGEGRRLRKLSGGPVVIFQASAGLVYG